MKDITRKIKTIRFDPQKIHHNSPDEREIPVKTLRREKCMYTFLVSYSNGSEVPENYFGKVKSIEQSLFFDNDITVHFENASGQYFGLKGEFCDNKKNTILVPKLIKIQ